MNICATSPDAIAASEQERAKQILTQLKAIKRELIRQNNAHVFFTNIYILATECLLDFSAAIDDHSHADHYRFAGMDSRLVQNLIHYFGQRYIDAYTAYHQQSGRTPKPWKITFEKSSQGHDAGAAMLLGAVTHISFDLPIVLAMTLQNGDILFDTKSVSAMATYRQVDHLIADRLPEMLHRTRTLQNQLNTNAQTNRAAPGFRYGRIHHRFGTRISRWFMYIMIRLTRQESRWLQLRLVNNECDHLAIEEIVCNRIRLISGDGGVVSFIVFLTYGLIARLANFRRLVPA